ncbi:MAG: hypothetical protein AAF654_02755 [Myxococcota bacterium]
MTERVTDIMLERYLAGDLNGEQRARVQSAIDASEDAQRRLEELSELRDSFFELESPEAFAHRLAVQLEHEAPRSRWTRWLLGPAFAVAVGGAAIGVIAVQSTDEAPELSSAFETRDKAPEAQSEGAPAAPAASAKPSTATPDLERDRERLPGRALSKRKANKRPKADATDAPVGSRGGREADSVRSFGSGTRPPAPPRSRAPAKKAARPKVEEKRGPLPTQGDAAPAGGAFAGSESNDERFAAPPAEEPSPIPAPEPAGVAEVLEESEAPGEPDGLAAFDEDAAAVGRLESRDNLDVSPSTEAPAEATSPAKGRAASRKASGGKREAKTEMARQSAVVPIQVRRVSPKGKAKVGEPVMFEFRGAGYFVVATRYRDGEGKARSTLHRPVRITADTQRRKVMQDARRVEVLIVTSPGPFDAETLRPWTRFQRLRSLPPQLKRSTYVLQAR